MDAAIGAAEIEEKIMATKQQVSDVMELAKCDAALAKEALRVTKGQHYTQAIIYAKGVMSDRVFEKTHGIGITGAYTAQQLADYWS